MQNKYIAPEMLAPLNLAQLGQVLVRRPKALLLGGGVHALSAQDSELFLLPPEVIFLSKVSEMMRLTRNDRMLEIGASVNLQRLLTQTQEYLPTIVIAAIKRIGNLAIRNQATVGGTLAIARYRSDLFVILAMLGANVEVRSFCDKLKRRKVRKLPLLRLVKDGFLTLDAGEIITTLYLPIVEVTHWNLTKLSRPFTTDKRTLLIAVTARIEKSAILTFHMTALVYGRYLVYDYALDAQFIGRRYPMTTKDLPFFYELIEESLDRDDFFLTDYVRYTIRNVVIAFLQKGQSADVVAFYQ